jgi:hypothetical protein
LDIGDAGGLTAQHFMLTTSSRFAFTLEQKGVVLMPDGQPQGGSMNNSELKQISAQLLAGMLANPHIYTSATDEEVRSQREQTLVMEVIELAEMLVHKVDHRQPPAES